MNSFSSPVQYQNCKIIFINLLVTERLILRSVIVYDAIIINKVVLESYDSLKEWGFVDENSCLMNNCTNWCSYSYSKCLRGEELIIVIIE